MLALASRRIGLEVITYSEPLDTVLDNAALGLFVLDLNLGEEAITTLVVRGDVFAKKHKVRGEAQRLDKLEDRVEVDLGLGEADAQEVDDGVQGHQRNDSHDPAAEQGQQKPQHY